MKSLFIGLMLVGALVAEQAPVNTAEIKAPAKTDAAKGVLPEVDAESVRTLKDAVIEGQSLQLQAAQIEKVYNDVITKLNQNAALQQTIMTEACKKAGLDLKRCSVDVSIKGVTTFKLASEDKK